MSLCSIYVGYFRVNVRPIQRLSLPICGLFTTSLTSPTAAIKPPSACSSYSCNKLTFRHSVLSYFMHCQVAARDKPCERFNITACDQLLEATNRQVVSRQQRLSSL
jgi:hypothetical protein